MLCYNVTVVKSSHFERYFLHFSKQTINWQSVLITEVFLFNNCHFKRPGFNFT